MYCSSNGCYSRQYYYYHYRDTLGRGDGAIIDACIHTRDIQTADAQTDAQTDAHTHNKSRSICTYIHTYVRTYIVDLAHAYPAELICRAYMHACMHTHTQRSSVTRCRCVMLIQSRWHWPHSRHSVQKPRQLINCSDSAHGNKCRCIIRYHNANAD